MTTSGQRLRSAVTGVLVTLVVAALVLTVLVGRAVTDEPTETADVGETFPLRTEPYGREVTVMVPGSAVTVTVGDPVDTLGHELLDVAYDDPRWDRRQDLGAPEGGTLVPVSWNVQGGGFLREEDPNPIAIRLVVGDDKVELASVALGDASDAHTPPSVAIAVDGEVDASEVALEVEYEGVTQTARIATGEIEAGVARALYEDPRHLTSGCAAYDDQCLLAADRAAPVRPDSSNLTVSDTTLHPYDAELGWADDGKAWAALDINLIGTLVVKNAAGTSWVVDRQSAPTITLDGAEPVSRQGLGATVDDTHGRVVFEVDAEGGPGELAIGTVLTLRGPAAPEDLPVHALLKLEPVA